MWTPITWNDQLKVGIAAMDGDHAAIAKAINGLIADMQARVETRQILAKAQDLGIFTARHFRHEEDSMGRHHYAGYRQHKRHHDALIQQLDAFSDRLERYGLGALNDEMLQFLRQWVVHHIVTDDRAYAVFLHDQGLDF